MTYIGKSVKRLEDLPLITGTAQFADDISFPNQLHMRVVRSPVAFGKLLEVDTFGVDEMPGVVAVFTHDDVADIPPIDFRQVQVDSLKPYKQPILAKDFVRYVGEPVAVVFAESPYLAEDAAEMVFADIEELDPYMCATDEPVEFAPGITTNGAVIEKSYGDLEQAFRDAHKVISLTLAVGRHTGVPIETRGCLATYDSSKDLIEVYGASKMPHLNREKLAVMLGLASPEEQLQIYESHVGGGFGPRGELYPEDVLVCVAAKRLQRPIKWIEDRKEHFLATNHSRDQVHQVRAGVDERGFILALDDKFWTDQGAYVRTHAATVTDLTAALLAGPYSIPAFRARGFIRLTNKTPAGTYRAPGRFEGTFVRERVVDEIATQLRLDPVEVRRVNLIPTDQMPFDRKTSGLGTAITYDSGDYHDLFDRSLKLIDYENLNQSLIARRAKGEMVGIGMGFFVEKSGLGPSDTVTITVNSSGEIVVLTGAASVGQGIETCIAQIVADALGADINDISVVHGRTDKTEKGLGAWASRATVMTGSAAHNAAEKLQDMLLNMASEHLNAAVSDLSVENGRILMKTTGAWMSFAELVVACSPDRTNSSVPVISAQGQYTTSHMVYPYGVHFVVAKVDPETCAVSIERYLVSYDVGKAVNPQLIEGQLVGAACQGIGGSLYEQFVYDEAGQPLVTTFMDYLMPTAAEMPYVETLVREDAPSPLNPLGLKGAGEGGITASGAAIAAAVDDAIGRPGAIRSLPITPLALHAILSS